MPGKRSKGISLVELLVAAVVLTIAAAGIFQVMTICFHLSELARNMSLAAFAAQSRIEEMRNTDFDRILSDYGPGGTPGPVFSLDDVRGTGIIDLTPVNPDLIDVRIAVCWQVGGRQKVVGEDKNLDGTLNGGEDKDGNGLIDSPVTLRTLMTRRP